MQIKLSKSGSSPASGQAPARPPANVSGLKYSLSTYGCTLNQSDSLAMRALLSQAGASEAKTEAEADVVIINSCTVKEATENKIAYQLRRLSHSGKAIVLAGCMSVNEELVFKNAPHCAIVGTSSIERICDAVESAVSGGKGVFKGFSPKSGLPRERVGPIAKIAIAEGCLSACTFCQTRLARGRLYSYPIESIVQEAQKWIAQGAVEIQLTGQDTGAYGAEIKTDVAKLLEAVCAIEGEFHVRLGMGNPEHFAKHLPGLLEAFSHPKMYKFIHIPVQAGSNRVLAAMKRDYTAGGFENTVAAFRSRFPGMTIATDIIVGFPTETDAEFQETLDLIRRVKFDVVNVSKFSPRPFTKAKEMRQVPKDVIKKRAEICSALCRDIALENNKKFVGKRLEMTVTERQKTLTGRDSNYRTVALPKGSRAKIGDRLAVLVKEARGTCLIGKPVA
ncbi:MAG: tRNA (N(6)-L-threonylcarbamoyladenosine(37)-C(2))-methylthiotransferase [Candidatus Micrarchaeia archaeon]